MSIDISNHENKDEVCEKEETPAWIRYMPKTKVKNNNNNNNNNNNREPLEFKNDEKNHNNYNNSNKINKRKRDIIEEEVVVVVNIDNNNNNNNNNNFDGKKDRKEEDVNLNSSITNSLFDYLNESEECNQSIQNYESNRLKKKSRKYIRNNTDEAATLLSMFTINKDDNNN